MKGIVTVVSPVKNFPGEANDEVFFNKNENGLFECSWCNVVVGLARVFDSPEPVELPARFKGHYLKPCDDNENEFLCEVIL